MINSLLFFGESTAMHLLQPDLKQGEMGTVQNTLIAGCFGGFLQCVMLVPVDVIKCNMQAENIPVAKFTVTGGAIPAGNAFTDTWKCMKSVYRLEGMKGFFKGFNATVARECPSIGGYFFSYKWMKDFFTKLEKRETPSTKAILISGGIAGAVSWTCVYPFDVIKTNIQIATGQKAMNKKGKITMLSMGKYLYRQHGASVFTRGLGATVIRAFPVNASTFYVYERLKEYFLSEGERRVL
jgi:solute carrier family 25 carnitine/acylcarnitine transporter 20/29